ncbi:MAG: hypothetical protein KJZ84_06980 [Bryobacteraceae bacterium]|nr:hypothetical protein [Bryobacteraceae bacterium]
MITPVASAAIVVAVALKLAEVAPAGTITAEGAVSDAWLLEIATAVPPLGAAALRVTVQVLLAPEVSDDGLQVRPVRPVGASRLIE